MVSGGDGDSVTAGVGVGGAGGVIDWVGVGVGGELIEIGGSR